MVKYMALQINGQTVIDTDYLKLATGNESQKPVTSTAGKIRFNTDSEAVEIASFSEIALLNLLWKQLEFTIPIPDTLTFALQQDTGSSSSDMISQNGTVIVSNINVINGSWKYSLDSGNTWSLPQSTSVNLFVLPYGTYPPSSVQVIQTNAVGVSSVPATNTTTIIIDNVA